MKRLAPGNPDPLGATSDGAGVNFAVFSAHAERVTLCLFTPDGAREIERIPLPARSGDVWHGYLPGAELGTVYGYRVDGSYDPDNGLCFNPNKLLVDPYARALIGMMRWNEANFAYRFRDPDGGRPFDERDSAPFVSKGIVTGPDRPQNPLGTPWTDTVLYELHVKGFTVRHPRVPHADRGRLKGLTAPAVLDYLRALGITAIELLPVFPFADETHLARMKLTNYWGYNPYNFFAVDPRYGTREDLSALIETCHDAGIEVVLDVVYNHTAESDALGPTLSLRGFDDRSYYWRDEDGRYVNVTGCGNTLNVTHPQVQTLVVDSLIAWAALGVDGFRFDLGSVLGRTDKGFTADAPLLSAISKAVPHVKLIAEPWDVGGYFVGQFPPGWAEWNDKFRDGVRNFWRGGGAAGEIATRMAGSSDAFRSPIASINFIASHDGFTLEDTVSYARKHNEANGESNRDGINENFSRNWGAEGPTKDPAVLIPREKTKRNLLASLFLAQGVPMLLAGDEIGHSQRGNNNAYCQDNTVSWIDWSSADETLLAWVQRLIAYRRTQPLLHRAEFFAGETQSGGVKDIVWLHPEGREIATGEWSDLKPFGFIITGKLIVLMNTVEPVPFVLPGGQWRVVLGDTAEGDVIAGRLELGSNAVMVLERV